MHNNLLLVAILVASILQQDIDEINSHLQEQDEKIEWILSLLEGAR